MGAGRLGQTDCYKDGGLRFLRMRTKHMNLRCFKTCLIAATALLLFTQAALYAQVRSATQANSATRVAAEMTKGRLNPAESKPGDTLAVRLKDDLSSNGNVVLKKGTIISGVVRSVKRADTKVVASGDTKTQSLIEIEWLTPASDGRALPNLSIALQSVTQKTPGVRDGSGLDSVDDTATVTQPIQTHGANSLVDGVVPAAANPALLSMPFVVAVDHQTSSVIEGGLESPVSGRLFKVGQGELLTSSGSQQSVDLFSHLDNDTVIAAAGKSFEISSGAQMQFLVGVHRSGNR
jgi:hypothetical protein